MSSTPFDPNIQSEKISFDAEEMIACEGCGRMNPPNRFKCLYCARDLEVSLSDAASVRPVLRKLELWERGFNVVVLEVSSGADAEKIAAFLSMDVAHIKDILDAGVPLPLARVESEKEANFLQNSLAKIGLKCVIVSDVDLAPDTLPVRLRALDISDETIAVWDFNTGEAKIHDLGDLVLAVTGSITHGRVDSLEKRLRGGKKRVLDETATTSDEAVLDIYTCESVIGYRINQAGFDFSCLGDDKSLLAGENLRLLVVRLKENAPQLNVINDYDRIRHALTGIWDIDSRNDPQGPKRSGFAKVEFGSVSLTSNLNQFTKYSRLRRHVYEAKR